MRLFSRFGLLAASLPLLAGCFDMTQSVTVAPNGTVTYVTEMAMMAEMRQMAQEEGDVFCPTEYADLPPGFTATAAESTRDDGDAVCTVTAVGPIDQLEIAIASGALVPGGVGEDAPVVTLVNEGGGVYTYTLTLTIEPEEKPATPATPPTPEEAAMAAQAEAMEGMILQAMEGRMLTWTLTAPRILSSTGTIEGNTATFALPLTVQMTEPGTEHVFTVRFAL